MWTVFFYGKDKLQADNCRIVRQLDRESNVNMLTKYSLCFTILKKGGIKDMIYKKIFTKLKMLGAVLLITLPMTTFAATGTESVSKPKATGVYSKVSGGTMCQATFKATCQKKGPMYASAMYYNKATSKYVTAHLVHVSTGQKASATTARISGKAYLWKLRLWWTGIGNGSITAR